MPKQTIRHGVKFTISLIVLSMFSVVIVDANKLSKTGNSLYVNPIFVQQTSSEEGYISIKNISIALDENERGVLKYIVQPGDSLYGIASRFGTTISRIKKVNNIRGPIRPNNILIISEDDGLIYIMKSGMNVKLFAEKYDLSLQDIMTLNGISDESEILQKGQELFLNINKEKSYDVGLLPRPKPIIVPPKKYKKPVITRISPVGNHRKTPTSVGRRIVSSVSNRNSIRKRVISKWTYNKKVSNGFYPGHCTWYMAVSTPSIFAYTSKTAQKRPFGGNANQWYNNAAAAGFRVGQSPVPGAIVVYSVTSGPYAAYGHVAKVISHDPSTATMILEDMNYLGKYIVTRRVELTNNPKIRGYIYP